MRHHARWAAPGLAAVVAAALLAGCGSGNAQNAGATPSASNRSSFTQCLKKHGITLPSRPSGGGLPSGGIPSGRAPGSAPPSGASGNGQGFPGGSRGGAFQKAIKACGGLGGGGFGGAPPG